VQDNNLEPPRSTEADPISARLGALIERVAIRHGLTRREKQVLEGAALGRNTKTVAMELLCSPKTIEEYWRRIYRRFKIASRQEILAQLLWESLTVVPEVAAAPPCEASSTRLEQATEPPLRRYTWPQSSARRSL
jgi:DNA-binding CsgD family transcriptional regulator